MAIVIIAKNQTAGGLTLSQLSVVNRVIPASGQVNLTTDNTVAVIQVDTELLSYINGDDVLLNRDAVDLTKAQSLQLMESLEPLHNLVATVDPVVGDDQNGGYSKGSMWVSNGKAFTCVSAAVGAAVWWASGESDTDMGIRSGIDISFFTSSSAYVEGASATPRVVARFLFNGTDITLPSRLKIIGSRSGTAGSSTVDLYNETAGTVVVTITFTSPTVTVYTADTLENLPTTEAIFAMRAYKATAQASKTQLHYVSFR